METEEGETKMRNGTQRDCLSVCGCAHSETSLQALRRFLPPPAASPGDKQDLLGAQLDRRANSLRYDTIFLTLSPPPNTQNAPRPVTQTASWDNPVALISARTGDIAPRRPHLGRVVGCSSLGRPPGLPAHALPGRWTSQ